MLKFFILMTMTINDTDSSARPPWQQEAHHCRPGSCLSLPEQRHYMYHYLPGHRHQMYPYITQHLHLTYHYITEHRHYWTMTKSSLSWLASTFPLVMIQQCFCGYWFLRKRMLKTMITMKSQSPCTRTAWCRAQQQCFLAPLHPGLKKLVRPPKSISVFFLNIDVG